MLLMVVTGWLDRREREVLAYLIEENRRLRRQLVEQRLRLTDDDRRRLAVRAYRLGRRRLRGIATSPPIRCCAGTGNSSRGVINASIEQWGITGSNGTQAHGCIGGARCVWRAWRV